MHACDGQTDRRTDRRTDRILIARPRLHSMQRGKIVPEMTFNVLSGTFSLYTTTTTTT